MYRKLLIVTFIIINISYTTFGQTIRINEIMSSNDNTLSDLDGDSEDWIELYNYGNQSINLENISLSDDDDNWDKWQFPDIVLAPDSYIILFASGKDKSNSTEIHTNFKVKQDGEALFLSNAGQLLSSTPAVFIPTDESYGVNPNDPSEYIFFQQATPKSKNVIYNDIAASHQSGFYDNEFNLTLTASNTSRKMYYTLNGSIPTPNSFEYTAPILVKNNSNTPNNFSNIPTTPLTGPDRLNNYKWQMPSDVYKSNVIRFASYDENERTSPIYSKTYFVDSTMKNRYNYPVISIITDSLNLFDYETGIYIPGKRFDEYDWGHHPNGNYQNRGRDWERPVHFTYFENDGELIFETGAGVRMRGLGGTAYPQKSFNVYFRDEYGLKTIEKPIFRNSDITGYKRFVLRNSGQDFNKTHFKDALLQSILTPLNLEIQNFQPTILFLNGEYWGIYNMREKYDEHYISNHFNVDKDDVNIVKWCGEIETGSDADYVSLMDYVYNNDLSENTHYQYIESQIDMSNYIDFQIAEIYYGNYDWPCNNYKMWKTNATDSKWRFLIHDLDFSFGYNNTTLFDKLGITHATKIEDGWPFCECSNIMFVKLLENETFKQLFINRFEELLSTTFSVENVLQSINDFTEQFVDEMPEHINRWFYPTSLSKWADEIEVLRSFAVNRPCYIKEDLMSFFNLSDFDYECPNPDDFIVTSNLVVAPNPNTGYFYLQNDSSSILVVKLTIRNVYGQIVHQKNNMVLYNYQKEYLDLQHLSNGTYFISFDYNEKTEVKKIVIVR